HVFNSMYEHNLKQMLDLGLLVTVNSDDPAYFSGYIAENFMAAQQALALDQQDIYQLVKNSYQATFLAPEEKQILLDELEVFMSAYK
ncbi:MAG: adenosine deaminase, partial [Dehalococcoidia bacterium]